MKAKELVQGYINNPTDESIVHIVSTLLLEIKVLENQRKVRKDSALISIIAELNDKYKACVREINRVKQVDISTDLFMLSLAELYPNLVDALKLYFKELRVIEGGK